MPHDFINETAGGLIVSCQALEDEPLHGSEIMAKMAFAAYLGGAVGIRANSVKDINAIRQVVDLPMIGIIKKVCGDSPVYITPGLTEVEALIATGVEVIALDATGRLRPDGRSLSGTFALIKKAYPGQLFMADCSTYEECVFAQSIGFDIVGTTLCGYTEETTGMDIPSLSLLSKLGDDMSIPVIAEGGIWEPRQLRDILRIKGIHAAVVGTAITRPLEITKRFVRCACSSHDN